MSSFTLAGQYGSRRLVSRVRSLERIQIMLSAIRANVEYGAPPVQSLMETLCARENLAILRFLPACRELCLRGMPFPAAWRKALDNRNVTAPLKPEDIGLLKSFGESLGTTDSNGLIGNCRLHQALFNDNLNAARQADAKYGKLFPVMGFLTGLAAVIIAV